MIVSGNIEAVDQAIFDTIYFPAKGNRAMGFTIPLGQQVLGDEGWKVKDYTDTNMLQGGMLDAPKQMEVTSIDCYLVSRKGIVPATARWYAELMMELQVSRKTMWMAPLAKCVNPVALLDRDTMWNTMLTKTDIEELKEKFQTALDKPITILQQECFNATIHLSDWACNQFKSFWRENLPFKVVVSLNGTLWRAVY